MSAERGVPEPGELVYPARPSWAPAIFASGAALALCGVFAGGFMVSSWVWSVIGGIVLLAALRSMVKGAVGDYYRLPRRQRVRGAVLPVEKIAPPRSSAPPRS